MLDYTISVADSLEMGVDLTLGTGWPWGGAHIKVEDAASKLLVRKLSLRKGSTFSTLISSFETGEAINLSEKEIEKLNLRKSSTPVQYVFAYDSNNNFFDLSPYLINNSLQWKAKDDNYTLFFIFNYKTEQKVKRAAPGGDGWVLDHFSESSLEKYLRPFGDALNQIDGKVRSVFNDSYEVYGADYTTAFFNAFQKFRAYDLKPHLVDLLRADKNEISNRLLSYYRETLSDLMIEGFNHKWNKWAKRWGAR